MSVGAGKLSARSYFKMEKYYRLNLRASRSKTEAHIYQTLNYDADFGWLHKVQIILKGNQ